MTVDEDTCVGHGRCYDIAPALFEPGDDEGRATVRADPVPEALHDAARRAAAACPEVAIDLVEAAER